MIIPVNSTSHKCSFSLKRLLDRGVEPDSVGILRQPSSEDLLMKSYYCIVINRRNHDLHSIMLKLVWIVLLSLRNLWQYIFGSPPLTISQGASIHPLSCKMYCKAYQGSLMMTNARHKSRKWRSVQILRERDTPRKPHIRFGNTGMKVQPTGFMT